MAIDSIDYSKCSACMKCWQICPTDVFRMAGREVYIAYPDDCMCCYLCELECPEEAILVTPYRTSPKTFPW